MDLSLKIEFDKYIKGKIRSRSKKTKLNILDILGDVINDNKWTIVDQGQFRSDLINNLHINPDFDLTEELLHQISKFKLYHTIDYRDSYIIDGNVINRKKSTIVLDKTIPISIELIHDDPLITKDALISATLISNEEHDLHQIFTTLDDFDNIELDFLNLNLKISSKDLATFLLEIITISDPFYDFYYPY